MTRLCPWRHALMLLGGIAMVAPTTALGQFLAAPDPAKDVLARLAGADLWEGRTSCKGTGVLVELRIVRLDQDALDASIAYTPEQSRISGHLGQKLRGRRSLWQTNDLELNVAEVTASSSVAISARGFRLKFFEGVISARYDDGACEEYPLVARKANEAPAQPGSYVATSTVEARCGAIERWVDLVDGSIAHAGDRPLVEVIAPAFADPHFRDVFGSSYEQMSVEERTRIKEQIEASCMGALDSLDERDLYSLFLRILAEDPDRPSLAFGYPQITAFIRSSDDLRERVEIALSAARAEPDPRVTYGSMKAAEEDIASNEVYLLPADAADLRGKVSDARNRSATAAARDDLDAVLATADPGARLRALRRHVDEPAAYILDLPGEVRAERESRVAMAFDDLFESLLAPEMSSLATQPVSLDGLRAVETSAQRNQEIAAAFPQSLSRRWREAVLERRTAILASVVAERRSDLERMSAAPADAPEVAAWLRDLEKDLGDYSTTQPYLDALARFREIRQVQLVATLDRFKSDLAGSGRTSLVEAGDVLARYLSTEIDFSLPISLVYQMHAAAKT